MLLKILSLLFILSTLSASVYAFEGEHGTPVPLWAVANSHAPALEKFDADINSNAAICDDKEIRPEIKNEYGYVTSEQLPSLALKAILYAFQLFPRGIFPMAIFITPTTRDPSVITLNQYPDYAAAGAVTIGGQIDLTLGVLTKMKSEPSILVATVVHEVGHQIDIRLNYPSHSKDWLNIGRWDMALLVADAYKFSTLADAGIISQYATTNPQEDFAESIAAYILIPDVLKKVSPQRFSFIKSKISALN